MKKNINNSCLAFERKDHGTDVFQLWTFRCGRTGRTLKTMHARRMAFAKKFDWERIWKQEAYTLMIGSIAVLDRE
jgi:hypothetical protein